MNRQLHGNPIPTLKANGKNRLLSIILMFTFVCISALAQNIRVKGTVMYAKEKEPIIGANVRVENTTLGSITDLDGNFTLEVPANGTLIVSYVGCKTQEIKVSGKSSFTILMEEDFQQIGEVVVVGYGSQKKINLTGAVAQIDSKVFESRPIISTSGGLQGTIPNLTITPSTGKPGESPNINIRGTTSINGGGPLILVDGVEMNMDLVNPNDIANVTVLKDAAAAAIYGVRAAYGVVLITTKGAGTEQRTVISYSGNVAFSKPSIMPEMVKTSWEHAEFINKAMINAGLNIGYPLEDIAKMKAYDKDPANNPEYEIINGGMRTYGYTDYNELMLRDLTPSHRHNVSVSGGTEKTKFFSSVGYVGQSDLYKINSEQFQRLNTRLSVENQTTSWMKLGMRMLYNYTTNNEPYEYKGNPWHQIVFSAPNKYAKKWRKDPRYPDYDQFEGLYFDDQNPVSFADLGGRNIAKQNDVWLTGSADFQIMKGWKARVDYTYNMNKDNNSEHKKKIDMMTYSFVPTEGNTSNNEYKLINNNRDYYSFNAYTEYEQTFAEKHYFKGMLGYNQELTKYQTVVSTRRDMLSQELPSLGLGAGDQLVGEGGYEWALRGGFFRMNYIYDNRYLLEVNGRYDGTSRFPKDNRFVFLPSFSAAWRISEEKFMEWSRKYFDNLKVRASYGLLGNQLLTASSWGGNTKYYPYVPFMSSGSAGNYIFGAEKALFINPAGLTSNNLTWEKAGTTNIGVDVTLLGSRLDASFDVYQRTTSDMLVKVEYPEIIGTTAPPANKAELRTRGWELSVNWRDRIGKDFTYDLGLVLADSQAEITKYENPSGTLTDHYVGKKMGEIWGYETEGFFQTEADLKSHANQSKLGANWNVGDIMYKDRSGNGTVDNGKNTLDDHGDLTIIGNETPRYTYGFTADLGYKNFFFSFFIQGVGKRDFWPAAQPYWPVATQYFNTQQWFLDDSWSEDNRNAYFARPMARDGRNRQKQSKYIQDASYLRLKNMSFGYNVPARWLKVIGVSKAQAYVSGENLFEITNVKGAYDPEAAAKNGSMFYPFQRTYSIGVNLTF